MKEMIYSNKRTFEILHQGKYKGYQYYICSLGTHPTAYIEIPKTSIFYKQDMFEIELDAHGGITYSKDYLYNITNSWFIGWDYAHFGDYYELEGWYPNQLKLYENWKKWTTEEILEEVKDVIEQIIEKEK